MIMCSKDLILETLKRIGYQDLGSLDDNDLNSLTSEKELKPFFEEFCSLDENNVLTSEEIETYSALTPADLAEIDILKKSCQFEKNDSGHEKKKEAYFLQEQLAQIENHNKVLEKQIDLFKKHEVNLLLEKGTQEESLLKAKKRFKKFEITKIPKAEEEFVSCLKSSFEVAQDLESLILHSDDNQNLPTSKFVTDTVQQYIKDEEKLLQCINIYMQTNFQLHENGTMSFINDEMLQNKELEKEASFLMKRLKSSMIDNVMSEMELCKTKGMVKHFENVSVSDFNCSSFLLRHKLDAAVKLNVQLKKTEEEYKTYICNAVTKHVDALVAETILCAANEMISNILLHRKKISVPKNYLIRQRLRVEKLIASLSKHMDNFQSIKEIIQKVLKEMNEEQLCLDERQIQIEKELSDVAINQDDQHLEAMVFSSLHKILASSDDFRVQELSKLSLTDIVQNDINKYIEVEELFRRKHEENKKVIDLFEKHTQGLESLLYAEKLYSDWHDLEQSFNEELNHLVMKLTAFEKSISECNEDRDQKQMILEKRRNIQIARHLYVYALMNKELFEKYIDEVKGRIENSTN